MKILLPVDGSSFSDAAIEEVARRPWPPRSEVRVVTAAETPVVVGMEPWAAPPEYFEQLEKSVREAAQDVINRALLKLKTTEEKTLKITSAVIQRPPREAIVEEVEKWGADLM
jgi:nucleotide-binding universal stress UspA family protein